MAAVRQTVGQLRQHLVPIARQEIADLQQAIIAQDFGRLRLVGITQEFHQPVATVREASTAVAPHQASTSETTEGFTHAMSGYPALSHQGFNDGKIVNTQGEEDPPGRFIGLETSVKEHQTGITEHSSILP